ncbi:MAG: hypothetical protein HZC54_04335 [Verrucomicrobia bacterium]|nr:hypothetical protein [Verrucomicrobiota bacterium]
MKTISRTLLLLAMAVSVCAVCYLLPHFESMRAARRSLEAVFLLAVLYQDQNEGKLPERIVYLELSKDSSEFRVGEFGKDLTADSLVKALRADGIVTPEANSAIQSLNEILQSARLDQIAKRVSLSKEGTNLMQRGATLTAPERTRLNRLLVETAYPQTCPKEGKELAKILMLSGLKTRPDLETWGERICKYHYQKPGLPMTANPKERQPMLVSDFIDDLFYHGRLILFTDGSVVWDERGEWFSEFLSKAQKL